MRHYVQTRRLSVEWGGIRLDVYCLGDDRREKSLEITWSETTGSVCDTLTFVPTGFQQAQIHNPKLSD